MNPDQFLLEDYKLKVGFLSNQYNGMWTRFNFFVTIESALIGGKFIFGSGAPGPALAGAGFVLSLIWYVLAAQDSYLARLYQKHIELAAQALGELPDLKTLAQSYVHVGFSQDQKSNIYKDIEGKSWLVKLMYWVTRWRWEPISVSKLIAMVPLLACLVWLGVLISQFVH